MSTGEKFAGLLLLLPATLILACHIPNPSSKVLLPLAVVILVWARIHKLPNGFLWLAAAAIYPGIITVTSRFPRPILFTSLQDVAIQLGAMALVVGALWRAPVSRMAALAGFVLFVASVGLIGEVAGLPVQQWLPWQSNQADEFASLSFYIDGSLRLRGFSPEAGVLSLTIVTSVLLFCAALEVCRLLPIRKTFVRLLQLAALFVVLISFSFVLTKSGITIVAGVVGAAFVGLLSFGSLRNKALVILLICIVGLAGGLTIGYGNFRFAQYLRSELQFLVDAKSYDASQQSSADTRVVGWRFAFAAAADNPQGVGRYGLAGTVAKHSEIPLTPELQRFFKLGSYGLKSAGANILANGGWIGVVLWLIAGFSLFILPVWRMRRLVGPTQYEAVFAFALGGGLIAGVLSAELFPYAGYWAFGGLLVHYMTELQTENALLNTDLSSTNIYQPDARVSQ